MKISFDIPVAVINFSNKRFHWAKKAKLTKAIRETSMQCANLAASVKSRTLPATVIMTRVYAGRSRPFDDDGLVRSMKAVRDGIATAWGADDGDAQWEWTCLQMAGLVNYVHVGIVTQ